MAVLVLGLKMASSCSLGILTVVADLAPEDILADILARLLRHLLA